MESRTNAFDKEFSYIVSDPTGNITVLILSSYDNDAEREQMIRHAFETEPTCEQAAFISTVCPGHVRLEMMGYEFCGNASLSAASWQALRDGIAADEEAVVLLDSSGVNETLEVRVKRLEDTDQQGAGAVCPHFTGSLMMPVPSADEHRGYPVIHLDGISHMIFSCAEFTMEDAEKSIREFARELDVPALGMMLCDTDPLAGTEVSIRPLVYVRDTDTVVQESGCATGSTALGWYRYIRGAGTQTDVLQPGGIITISIKKGRPELTGSVILTKL